MSKKITVANIVPDEDVAELQDFEEGDWVQYNDDQVGVIVGKLTESFEWPSENVPEDAQAEVGEDEEIDEGMSKLAASSDDPVYIVARASGGSKPFHSSDLESISRDEAVGDLDVEDPEEDLDDAEMSATYSMVDNPYSIAELQNIPGVRDPHIGFKDWPDSWKESEKPARLIALDAWSSLGGTFRTCRADMAGRISRPARFCAAFKDEMLGTTRWRNRF